HTRSKRDWSSDVCSSDLLLRECSHNLIEIQAQIIDYLNQIDLQGEFLEQLRKVKYLKDHFTLEAETDIKQILSQKNQVIFEKRVGEPLNLSLGELQNNESAFETIKRVAARFKDRQQHQPVVAEKIADEFLEDNLEEELIIDFEEIRNHFVAGGQDLFNFILNYDFLMEVDFEKRVTIFCQMASQYELDFEIEDDYAVEDHIEYAMIYP